MPQAFRPFDVAVPQPRLPDRVRHTIRLKHYSIRTEKGCVDWVRRYVHFHGLRHPDGLGAQEVDVFSTHLAVEGNVAASTQGNMGSGLLCCNALRSILFDCIHARSVMHSRKPALHWQV